MRYQKIRKDPVLHEKRKAAVRVAARNYYYRNRNELIKKVKAWGEANPQKRAKLKAEYRRRHKEELTKKDRDRYWKYRDESRKKSQQWYLKNREYAAQKAKEWRQKNRERYRELGRLKARRYAEKNPERVRATVAAWRKANKDKLAHYASTRRVRKIGNGGTHTLQEWKDLVKKFNGKCFYCADPERPVTKDHLIPISKGGTDDIENIVPACRNCNSEKGSLTADQYLSRKQKASK